MRHLVEFSECEHAGDEQRYLENLHAHPQIASATTVARSYDEETIIVRVETDLTASQAEAIGWGDSETGN